MAKIVAQLLMSNGDTLSLIGETKNEIMQEIKRTYDIKKDNIVETEVILHHNGKEKNFVFRLSEADKELNSYFRWDRLEVTIQKLLDKMEQ